jgi:hypothetical protein
MRITRMFTTEERDNVRERVLEVARSDPRVTGGALTGSAAEGAEDARSDIDVAFGIAEEVSLEAVLDDWTEVFGREFGVLHHWDLRSGASIYRVFLLPSGLEIDVGLSPQQEFGARGPRFSLLFGTARQVKPPPQPDPYHLVGLGWHHVFHARSSIERGKPLRAEYWIREVRDKALTLACLRLGEEPYHARGIDRLPATVTEPLAGALVRSLDERELRRALGAATGCFMGEVDLLDTMLCERLKPLLQEFGYS